MYESGNNFLNAFAEEFLSFCNLAHWPFRYYMLHYTLCYIIKLGFIRLSNISIYSIIYSVYKIRSNHDFAMTTSPDGLSFSDNPVSGLKSQNLRNVFAQQFSKQVLHNSIL